VSANNPVASSGVHIALRTSGGSYYLDTSLSNVNTVQKVQNTDCNAFIIYVNSGTTLTNFKLKPQLEFGNTATAWTPYSNICPITGHDSGVITVENDQIANTYTVDFGQTVYGGSLDVTRGKLYVTHKYQRGGFSRKSIDSSNKLWYCGDLSDSKEYASVEAPNAISNMFVGKPLENCRADNSGFTIFPRQLYIAGYVGNESALDALLSNLEIAYELATPIEIQLTPVQVKTLLGNNNIFTDTNGDTSVVYVCSLKDYIDRQ
jgi:hypothetical protein